MGFPSRYKTGCSAKDTALAISNNGATETLVIWAELSQTTGKRTCLLKIQFHLLKGFTLQRNTAGWKKKTREHFETITLGKQIIIIHDKYRKWRVCKGECVPAGRSSFLPWSALPGPGPPAHPCWFNSMRRPANTARVPMRQTSMKTPRRMWSITIATYFHSSAAWWGGEC